MIICEYEINNENNQIQVQSLTRDEKELEIEPVLDEGEEECARDNEQSKKRKRNVINWSLLKSDLLNKEDAIKYVDDLDYRYIETRKLVRTEKTYFVCNKGVNCKSEIFIQKSIYSSSI
jgi:hypothetical protein